MASVQAIGTCEMWSCMSLLFITDTPRPVHRAQLSICGVAEFGPLSRKVYVASVSIAKLLRAADGNKIKIPKKRSHFPLLCTKYGSYVQYREYLLCRTSRSMGA